MYVLGHRGIPKLLKENTLPSLLKAIELGADGIETDIRLTKDGVPVIIHDDNLLNFCDANILTGDITFEELKNYKDGEYTVPSLRELLDSLPPGKIINLEIKEYEAGEITVELSKDYPGEVIYSSFDHKIITELKYKYPTCKFGY
ncbi:MAG: glycerophosphodiester phosphodiesterase family protein, partial [Fervidobacterium sp.]